MLKQVDCCIVRSNNYLLINKLIKIHTLQPLVSALLPIKFLQWYVSTNIDDYSRGSTRVPSPVEAPKPVSPCTVDLVADDDAFKRCRGRSDEMICFEDAAASRYEWPNNSVNEYE